jgi:citrate synthase
MPSSLHFTTTISGERDGQHELRGVPLTQLIAEEDFIGTLFLSLTGRRATATDKHVLDAIMTGSIDHGADSPSMTVARMVASTGNDAVTALSALPTAMGRKHGGAVSGCMEVLYELQRRTAASNDAEASAREIVIEYRERGERIPGYGHAVYRDEDPRSTQLFEIAREVGLEPTFVNLALTLEQALEQIIGRKLVLNVDGANAALLASLDIPAAAGNALFAVARMAGAIAHIVEEQEQGKMRRISGEDVEYSFAKEHDEQK